MDRLHRISTSKIDSFPSDATHVFVSCGGNDAIDNVDVLNEAASTVESALDKLYSRREDFRLSYASAIDAVRAKCKNTAAFTVYNKIPELPSSQVAALALFNEVILEELAPRNMPIIDLRVT